MKLFIVTLIALCSLLGCPMTARGACNIVNDETANFDDFCRTNFRVAPDHVFPDEYSILFDTYDFNNILPTSGESELSTRDVDGVSTSTQGIWRQSGGVCQYALDICSRDLANQNMQDNWVFSSYIRFPNVDDVSDVQSVFFDISFRFTQCSGACTNDFATMYRYNANSPVSEAQRTTTSNYVLLGGLPDSRIRQGSASGAQNPVFSVARQNTNGFYLAFRDQGNCGDINRVIVYYRRSPSYTGTLLTCPSVPFPTPNSGVTTSGACCCGTNAEPKGSLDRVCSDDETCTEPSSDVCGCSPGYQFVSGSCQPCPVGMFQPDISITSMCEMCPDNSVALFPATAVCNCTGATTRNPAFPRNPCAQPPSAPLLTVEPVVDGTFTTVFWSASLDRGGLDDLHYNIYVHRVGSDGPVMYTKVNSDPIIGTGDLRYDVPGLDGRSSYAIVVVAANGATGDPETLDQQLTGVEGHYVAYFVDTGEPGLARGSAIALTFFLTLILVAVITAAIVIVIMWFACVKRNTTMATSPKTVDHSDSANNNYSEARNPSYAMGKVDSTPPARPRPPPPRPPIRPKV